MNYYKQKVLEKYGRVLAPELGEGDIKRRLLSELEIILDHIPNHAGISSTIMSEAAPQWERPIDYGAIRRLSVQLGYKQVDTRLANALRGQGVTTYTELLTKYKIDKALGYRFGFANHLQRVKNLGPRSADVLLRHLELIGLEIPQ